MAYNDFTLDRIGYDINEVGLLLAVWQAVIAARRPGN